jgi:asparagine synthase (glutamine-hydrolysing)
MTEAVLVVVATRAAWHLLSYAPWHRRHIEGRRSERDVFEAQSAR